MKPYTSIELQLSDSDETNRIELDSLLKLSNADLFKNGGFDRLKTLSLPHYKSKYKEYFGSEAPE
jgi:hypothetical protein